MNVKWKDRSEEYKKRHAERRKGKKRILTKEQTDRYKLNKRIKKINDPVYADRIKEIERNRYIRDKEKRLAISRQYYLKNIEKSKEYAKNYRLNHLYEEKIGRVKREFGLSPEQYLAIVKSQNNECAICGKTGTIFQKGHSKANSLCIDHNHKTKKVRGLLCSNCNIGIGNLKDDVDILKKAINYLIKHDSE